jgi:hypothetical protein
MTHASGEIEMLLGNIYTALRSRDLETGTVHISTTDMHRIDVHVYSGIIVDLDSFTLSLDQIIETLLSGDADSADVVAADVDPGSVKHEVIEKLFYESTHFALQPDGTSPARLLRILHVMASLARRETGIAAFDMMASELVRRYRKFSLESATVRERIDSFSAEYLIAVLSPDSSSMPSGERNIPGWVFNSVTMPASFFREIVLYYIFFGELSRPVFRTVVKKEAGADAKAGFARISKAVYSATGSGSAAIIFKGAAEMGALDLAWHSENNTGLIIPQADLERLNVKDGDMVSLVLMD